jgi:sec-independent protein translocase protein TatB
MFGLGFTEILLIVVVAILFLGPDKLPGAMVDIAKFFKQVKNTVLEAKEDIEKEIDVEQLKREALQYQEDLHKASNELDRITSGDIVKDEMNDLARSVSEDGTATPKPKAAPTEEPKREVVTFERKKKEKKKESDEEIADA